MTVPPQHPQQPGAVVLFKGLAVSQATQRKHPFQKRLFRHLCSQHFQHCQPVVLLGFLRREGRSRTPVLFQKIQFLLQIPADPGCRGCLLYLPQPLFQLPRCIGQRFPAGAVVYIRQRPRAQRDPAQDMPFLAAQPLQFDHTLLCQLLCCFVDSRSG